MTNLNGRGDGILLVHNTYQQAGGEDHVFEFERRLLENSGHRVCRYVDDNKRIDHIGRLPLAAGTMWNHGTYRRVSRLLREERIGLIHLHNTFPLISPSIYYAARRTGVPVVQTLHNYRLLCPDAKLMRNGQCCEDCLGLPLAWPGMLRGCYQHSRSATAVTALMTGAHKLLGTWSRCIDRYIALTEFARRKFIQGGLPASRIAVKPNFVDPDPGPGTGQGGYGLFVGRLAPEKGISTLIAAWERLQGRVPLRVIGNGPLSEMVREAAARNPSIHWMGALPPTEVMRQMQNARFLVCPSVWYESFGLIIVEAFSAGLPVIASNLGAMAELVEHERTGLLFAPGNDEELASRVMWALGHSSHLDNMRSEARREYEERYTAVRNYQILMSIYRDATDERSLGARPMAQPHTVFSPQR
jgi:glycosyltransferase involved in cell wall biosynthesis